VKKLIVEYIFGKTTREGDTWEENIFEVETCLNTRNGKNCRAERKDTLQK